MLLYVEYCHIYNVYNMHILEKYMFHYFFHMKITCSKSQNLKLPNGFETPKCNDTGFLLVNDNLVMVSWSKKRMSLWRESGSKIKIVQAPHARDIL